MPIQMPAARPCPQYAGATGVSRYGCQAWVHVANRLREQVSVLTVSEQAESGGVARRHSALRARRTGYSRMGRQATADQSPLGGPRRPSWSRARASRAADSSTQPGPACHVNLPGGQNLPPVNALPAVLERQGRRRRRPRRHGGPRLLRPAGQRRVRNDRHRDHRRTATGTHRVDRLHRHRPAPPGTTGTDRRQHRHDRGHRRDRQRRRRAAPAAARAATGRAAAAIRPRRRHQRRTRSSAAREQQRRHLAANGPTPSPRRRSSRTACRPTPTRRLTIANSDPRARSASRTSSSRQFDDPALPPPHLPGLRNAVRNPLAGARRGSTASRRNFGTNLNVSTSGAVG